MRETKIFSILPLFHSLPIFYLPNFPSSQPNGLECVSVTVLIELKNFGLQSSPPKLIFFCVRGSTLPSRDSNEKAKWPNLADRPRMY